MGDRTISAIVEETCQALYEVLKDKYLKVLKKYLYFNFNITVTTTYI